MTLRSLEIFESVARLGKMSDAANELFIAQPTISQAIIELEKEFGVLLFERLSKKLFITKEGMQFLEYAKEILSSAKELEKCMLHISSHKTILLGATITVGKCILVDIVKNFENMNTDTKINVIIDNTTIIEDLLLSSKLDIALVEGNIKSKDLISIPAIPDKLVFVCHHNHLLAGRESITVQDLHNHDFILREEGSGTREIFINKLKEFDININVKWSSHGFDSIIEALLANQGITVISERIAKPYVNNGTLKIIEIQDFDINRNFSLVYHKNKFISKQITDLINIINIASEK